MKTNIPIYRAKCIKDSKYIQGNYLFDEDNEKHYIVTSFKRKDSYTVYLNEHEIEPSTLAINFPGMLDKNNKPIFASLSEGGNGGCIGNYKGDEYVARFINKKNHFEILLVGEYSSLLVNERLESTGIYEASK